LLLLIPLPGGVILHLLHFVLVFYDQPQQCFQEMNSTDYITIAGNKSAFDIVEIYGAWTIGCLSHMFLLFYGLVPIGWSILF
jgi:hypothetical protein